MNIQNSFNKIEVTVWDWIIKLMTESPFFRTVIKRGFYLVKDKEIVWLAGLFLAWVSVGITVGYFLGFSGMR
jgi:hypothetical protein